MPYLFWIVLPLAWWDTFASPRGEQDEQETWYVDADRTKKGLAVARPLLFAIDCSAASCLEVLRQLQNLIARASS